MRLQQQRAKPGMLVYEHIGKRSAYHWNMRFAPLQPPSFRLLKSPLFCGPAVVQACKCASKRSHIKQHGCRDRVCLLQLRTKHS